MIDKNDKTVDLEKYEDDDKKPEIPDNKKSDKTSIQEKKNAKAKEIVAPKTHLPQKYENVKDFVTPKKKKTKKKFSKSDEKLLQLEKRIQQLENRFINARKLVATFLLFGAVIFLLIGMEFIRQTDPFKFHSVFEFLGILFFAILLASFIIGGISIIWKKKKSEKEKESKEPIDT